MSVHSSKSSENTNMREVEGVVVGICIADRTLKSGPDLFSGSANQACILESSSEFLLLNWIQYLHLEMTVWAVSGSPLLPCPLKCRDPYWMVPLSANVHGGVLGWVGLRSVYKLDFYYGLKWKPAFLHLILYTPYVFIVNLKLQWRFNLDKLANIISSAL